MSSGPTIGSSRPSTPLLRSVAVPEISQVMEKIRSQGDLNFVYALYRLDHVLCEPDTISLSSITSIKKIRKVTAPAGKALLGAGNRARSQQLAGRQGDAPRTETSKHVYPPFTERVVHMPAMGLRTFPSTVPEHSDCVVECTFQRNDPRGSNERMQSYYEELKTLMTALRLMSDIPIRGIGPVEIRCHPAINGCAIGSGGLEDEVLGLRHLPLATMMTISRKDATSLRRIFSSLVRLGKNKDWVESAIMRLHLAQTRLRSTDRLIDYAIGLEGLFGGSSAEVRFRCAGALADKLIERSKIDADVGAIFKCRNKVVHGSSADLARAVREANTRFSNESELIDCARSLLRRACLRAVQSTLSRENFRRRCEEAVLEGHKVSLT